METEIIEFLTKNQGCTRSTILAELYMQVLSASFTYTFDATMERLIREGKITRRRDLVGGVLRYYV